MLIKEYRIPLPLTVEEYRIAQLFMIAVSVLTQKENRFVGDHLAIISFNRKKAAKKAVVMVLASKLS